MSHVALCIMCWVYCMLSHVLCYGCCVLHCVYCVILYMLSSMLWFVSSVLYVSYMLCCELCFMCCALYCIHCHVYCRCYVLLCILWCCMYCTCCHVLGVVGSVCVVCVVSYANCMGGVCFCTWVQLSHPLTLTVVEVEPVWPRVACPVDLGLT